VDQLNPEHKSNTGKKQNPEKNVTFFNQNQIHKTITDELNR